MLHCTLTGMVTKNPSHLYIKEWMEHLGVSDETMAGLLGIERTSVWRLYTEQNRLNPEKILAFSNALGLNQITQLYFPPDVQSLDAIVKGASNEQRAMAADVVRRIMERAS
jgi:DNA-binding XRE family transcriptional regulator